jgi:hypothetical protein
LTTIKEPKLFRISHMKRIILIGLTAIFILACSTSSNKEKFCNTYSIALNKVSKYYDGQWQGIIATSDGSCYFGSACHSLKHGGGFFHFDPKTKNFEVLTDDLTNLVGDDITKHTPQGKCHSPVIEIDGTLYLSTHLAAYWPEVLDQYAGSHIMSYNMLKKEWRNYGIVKPRFSTYSAIEVDPKRGKIYAMIVPFAPEDKAADGNHLFQIDIKSGEKKDLGKVNEGKANFWFYLDDTGKLWFPMWYGSNKLYCYDPEADKIIIYDNAFPEPRLAPDGKPVKHAMSGNSIAWTWASPIEGGKRCLFTMGDHGGGDERLWIFDPSKDIKSKEAFIPVCYIGNTFLSVALGGKRVYFIQMNDNAASRGYECEINRELPPDKNGYQVHNLHLRSVALDPADPHQFIDHGRIIDQDGRTPAYIGSLAANEKGDVFIDGSWLIKPGDQPTLRFVYGAKEGQEYETLKRGEFFAWINVSNDLK